MSQDGIKKLQDTFRTFHNDLFSIIMDSKNKGEIPTFAVAFMDVLIDDSDEFD